MADIIEEAVVKDETAVEASKTSEKKKKKFDKNSIAWCVGILLILALVAGALLGVVNMFTYVDPNQAIMDEISGNYAVDGQIAAVSERVINSDVVNGSIENCFEFVSGGEKTYAYYAIGKGSYSGTIEFVFYIKSGAIDKVTVYAQSETATIGGKTLQADNLAKLEGLSLSSVTDYGKAASGDASSADYYVSGATMTAKGTTNALRAVAYAYNTYEEAEA